MRRLFVVFILSSSVLSLACARQEPQKTPLTNVRVQFGWVFDAHQVGFLLAAQRGYYEAEGLRVSLLPGSATTDAIRSVATGTAEIGQISGPEQLDAAAAAKLPIEAIAAFQRRSPHALISLDRNPIRTPSDIRGKRILVAFGDAAEIHLRTAMNRYHVAASEVTMLPFHFDLSPLRTGKADAITGFLTDQPFTLQAEGLAPVVLPYYTLGDESYGYMFVTSKTSGSVNRTAIERFLRASRRGWKAVFADPEGTLKEVAAHQPSWNVPVERKKLDAIRALMLDAKGQLDTWTIDIQRIDSTARDEKSPVTDLSSFVQNDYEEKAERQ